MVTPPEEPIEDLEPLFDYSRVQPTASFNFPDQDDDEDCYPIEGGKRKRNKGSDYEKGKGKGKGKEEVVEVDEKDRVFVNLDDDDDEDWLAPPPKVANTSSRFQDDKTLQELRLKKQELASVAESAERLLKEVSTKREFISSATPFVDDEVEKPPKHKVERQKIVISIQGKDGQNQFRVYKDDKFERLLKKYADKVKVGLDRLVFSFDGDKVGLDATPDSLGMEDDDMIQVHVKPQ